MLLLWPGASAIHFTGDYILRPRALYTLAGEKPARGSAIFAPLARLDNPLIIIKNGVIADIRRSGFAAAGDHGDLILIPPVVNAHTHTQLSWLAARTRWGLGFTSWLKSMVPHLLPTASGFPQNIKIQAETAIHSAWEQLAQCGTGWVGDVGGSIPGALSIVCKAASANDVDVIHFCEWFGFGESTTFPWPPRCAPELAGKNFRNVAPAGHALYSTSPEVLCKLKDWCVRKGRVFTFHLAESDEETEALLWGSGGLVEYYRGVVLPPEWQPPRARPLQYALQLGLLGPSTLAVHGVKLNNDEIDQFSESGASLCLCPRSNKNLNVGLAPVQKLLESGTLLCLGTDGLTSNTDLDVRNEAMFLRETLDLPTSALLRMLTVNGAAALGMPPENVTLAPGRPAVFSSWIDK